MGVMYVVISYIHASYIGIDFLYPGRWENHFYELLFEYSFGWFMMINTVYNYWMAAFRSPHSNEPITEVKLTEKSFKKLIKMNKAERKHRDEHE